MYKNSRIYADREIRKHYYNTNICTITVSTSFIYPSYWNWQAWTNSVDPDQMLHSAASDQGPHCLPLIQQIWTLTGSKIDLFKYLDKYGEELTH